MTARVGDDGAKRRRVSPVLLVVLGVVAVGALVYLVTSLGGGGSQQPAPSAPGPAASPTGPGAGATPTATPSPTPSPTSGAETFELFESKDPFRPLVVESATPGATGGTPSPTPATSPGAGAGGAPAPPGGQPVELLDVIGAASEGATPKAQVKVGDTVHTVAPGETFASTFKVLSISGTCATMLNGDDKFTLCKGEQVLK